jgi:hypothetical protein
MVVAGIILAATLAVALFIGTRLGRVILRHR